MVWIEAEWALWGKQPGGRDDVVLACSEGGFQAAQFKEIINRFAPGNPDGPDALPRVTISWVGAENDPQLGMAIQSWSGDRDRVGREIAQTRYFCLRYAQLLEHQVSYHDLYEALNALPLSEDHRPVRVQVRELDADHIAADLEQFGIRNALGIAAMLLIPRQPVCILQAENTTFHERLRFLDAVTALLPYGYRTRLTASTWTNSASPHRIRLSFATSPREEAHSANWQESAQIPVDIPVASPYFAMLDGVLTHMGGAPVVRLMAADITARRFDDPGHAVTSVHKIAWPHLALSQIEGGSAEPEGVRDLFDGDAPGIMALEPADRPTALAHLIGLADPQDRRRIDTWTPIIGRDDPIPVLKALASVARKLMWQQERIGVRGYLRLADELGHADPFLAALMRPPAGVDELESGLGQASQLLYDHVIATGETGSYKNTVTALSANPAVVCELMVQLAQDDPSFLHSALAWLVPAIPELLRPFQVVLLASEPLNDGDIEELAAHGRSCVRAVLKAACDRNRLHLVLDAFISWLDSQSTLDQEEWNYWARQFGDLNPADPKTQAAVDVLLMVVGAVPTKMTHVPDSRWSAYVDGFMRAWTRPWTGDHRTALLPGMCMHLHGISWQAHPGRADGVVQLVERLIAISTPGEGTYLTQILVESLHTSPSLAADLYAKGWLEQRREEGARLPASDPKAATVTPPEPPLKAGQNADQIIGALVDAHRSGRELDQAFEPLVANGAIGDATTARTVIGRLPIALLESGASPAQANAWTLALADRMANGTCGTRLAADFSRVMMESVPDEVRFVLKLLETVARDGSDGPPELTGRSRNMLTESLKDLQRVLKRAQPESTSPAGLNWVRSGPKNDPTARKTR